MEFLVNCAWKCIVYMLSVVRKRLVSVASLGNLSTPTPTQCLENYKFHIPVLLPQ